MVDDWTDEDVEAYRDRTDEDIVSETRRSRPEPTPTNEGDSFPRAERVGAFVGRWGVRAVAAGVLLLVGSFAWDVATGRETQDSSPAWGNPLPTAQRHDVQVGDYGIIRRGGVVVGSVFDESGATLREKYLEGITSYVDEGKTVLDGVNFCVLVDEGDPDALRALTDATRGTHKYLDEGYSLDVARSASSVLCPIPASAR